MEDDCISRQSVLNVLTSIAKVKAKSDEQKALMGRVMFFIEQLPSVNPQEPILDKIRAEIRQTSETVDGFLMHDGTKRTVLQILDKYKAESEDKECR